MLIFSQLLLKCVLSDQSGLLVAQLKKKPAFANAGDAKDGGLIPGSDP